MKHAYHLRKFSSFASNLKRRAVTTEVTTPLLGKRIRRSNSSSSSSLKENLTSSTKRHKTSQSQCNDVRRIKPLLDMSQTPPLTLPSTRRQSVPNCIQQSKRTPSSSFQNSRPQRTTRVSRRKTMHHPELDVRVELCRLAPVTLTPQMNGLTPNRKISTESAPKTPPKSKIFSPRRFTSNEKDQAAKLKRLNTRRIEFDMEEANHLNETVLSDITSDSILNQSVVGDPLEKLLGICKQTEIRSFDEYFESETLDNLVKLGEGVYGEVFQAAKGHVIKIFPVDGTVEVNGEKQMTFSGVYPEVFVSLAAVVYGKLPRPFVLAWRRYKDLHGSDNECPDFLPRDQQWMILEFEYAGEPLANMRFNNCREARSVIEQIALSLAAAESSLQFEHRDLHWHNILVRPTRQWKIRYRVNGKSYSILTEGILVTIIDFTVSRLCHAIVHSSDAQLISHSSFQTSKEGNIVYVDMANSPEIFECSGDYQFDIYRIMRDNNNNNWRPFKPLTNIYWLHYLMGKLLNETSYPRRDPNSLAVTSELTTLYDLTLTNGYKSVSELIQSNFYFDTCRV